MVDGTEDKKHEFLESTVQILDSTRHNEESVRSGEYSSQQAYGDAIQILKAANMKWGLEIAKDMLDVMLDIHALYTKDRPGTPPNYAALRQRITKDNAESLDVKSAALELLFYETPISDEKKKELTRKYLSANP
ncbi:hypothetical protein HQ545_04610 [Candidatus Woesearchaeota archaeon]|nr:hypothetical protein [Candidatus Woesearchaeota archaeon]